MPDPRTSRLHEVVVDRQKAAGEYPKWHRENPEQARWHCWIEHRCRHQNTGHDAATAECRASDRPAVSVIDPSRRRRECGADYHSGVMEAREWEEKARKVGPD